jgi:membrane protease YdiL (CAAX protease family)
LVVNDSAFARESASPPSRTDDRLIASRLHTFIVLLAVVVWAYGGMLAANRLSTELHPHRVGLFLFSIGAEWLMFALILVGVLRARMPLSCVIGEPWRSPRGMLRDIGFAAAFWVAAIPALYLLKSLLHVTGLGSAVVALFPRGALEVALWIVFAISAGVCEEAIFRGYLQRQLTAIVRRRSAGILLAATAFGLAHLYQGWRMATVIGLYGLMFGLFAHWRRSVRPGMIAHAWQDALVGVLGATILRH